MAELPDNPDARIRRANTEALKCAPTTSDLNALPHRVDRKAGAELVTRFFFPLSNRTLETWVLTWRHVNGKAVCETTELFALAQAKLDAAPPIRSGRAQRAT